MTNSIFLTLVWIAIDLMTLQIVDESSAQIGIVNEKLFPIEADHQTICRCPSSKSQEYEAVGEWIAHLIKSSGEGTTQEGPEVSDRVKPPR